MSWRFIKFFNLGPFRTSLSKRGLGTSIGVRGFRLGINAYGKTYITVGFGPIRFFRYLSGSNSQRKTIDTETSLEGADNSFPETDKEIKGNVEMTKNEEILARLKSKK
jgi:hypothetical protein